MNIKTKLVLFWIILLVCMILHFNYHISGIIYGINVVSENANGKEPVQLLAIRTLFYHLPLIWIVCIIYGNKIWLSLVLFVISVLYFIAHAAHFTGTLLHEKGNFSQSCLLFLTGIISAFLAFEHLSYYRSLKRQ